MEVDTLLYLGGDNEKTGVGGSEDWRKESLHRPRKERRKERGHLRGTGQRNEEVRPGHGVIRDYLGVRGRDAGVVRPLHTLSFHGGTAGTTGRVEVAGGQDREVSTEVRDPREKGKEQWRLSFTSARGSRERR